MSTRRAAFERYEYNHATYGRQMHEAFDDLIAARESGVESAMVSGLADLIRSFVPPVMALHEALNPRIPIPGTQTLYFYMGDSQVLDRVKLGITGNIAKREKSLRASMTGLGFPPDFQMFEFTLGDAQEVRRIEKQALTELADFRVGGEWFMSACEVFDWFFEAGRHLEDHYASLVNSVDIEQHILAALYPPRTAALFEGVGRFNPAESDGTRAKRLRSLWNDWFHALTQLLELRNSRHGGHP